jgi:hypothetical protein
MTNLDSNGLLQDREIIRLKIQKNIQFLYYLAINSKVALMIMDLMGVQLSNLSHKSHIYFL